MLGPMAPTPPRTRLLHIGAMKSGTTAVQRAASQRRTKLLESGVRYPGKGLNHFTPVAAFMGVRREGEYPDLATWHQLMDEVEGDETNRILISHEWACEADDAMAQRFIDALGQRTHVAITLRPLSGMLGSYWQEIVKNGRVTPPFETWLRDALAAPPGLRRDEQWDRQSDQAGMVERWERLLGPDRVTVIIADKTDPTRVPASLERLLDLPSGMLAHADADGGAANRSLSPAEAEFFRRQNEAFRRNGVPFREYALAYRRQAVARMLRTEPEVRGEQRRILLPQWAAERAATYGREIADRIADSRVNVIGDLASLHAPVGTTEPGEVPVPDSMPIDTAVEAVVASVMVGNGRAGRPQPATRPRPTPAESAKERVRELPGGPTILRGARAVLDQGHAATRRLHTLRATTRRPR
ncbi:hypothetical protein O9K63_13905 [Janibacter cremeus]|uniref:hypothetical protein n=1 Tax=Janibacter cremeus TaxID=1285192 RepID=UPI0023F99CC6|nr:hypothetical protein [Janibacter cremeus]WEV77671.1 hypothetical protein O9K63_13905 [Janibacter cremeus]